jgi:hypothetical protein
MKLTAQLDAHAQWKGGLRKARMSMHTECACMDTCCSIVWPPRWSQMCLFYGLMCRIGIVFNKLSKHNQQALHLSQYGVFRVSSMQHRSCVLDIWLRHATWAPPLQAATLRFTRWLVCANCHQALAGVRTRAGAHQRHRTCKKRQRSAAYICLHP